ncbi:ABC transporter substrate-binding protein [Verticiella sediminum]|uniref:ABC transporter substrate-binding protein n=1 Tax=Verticiella sediminum TaxID=1247510 RepID=A0A556AB79_9BURK|nr:ABC transporter substrate-binding protein [Verticiella sediminum]TSH90142.1 ABC transporter substrate-binding protein [Verticiella sediminum]
MKPCVVHRLVQSCVGMSLLAVALLAGAAEPHKGGRLTLVQPIEPPALVSAVNTSAYLATMSTKIMEGLLQYDADLNPQPALATSWDESPDGKRYVFHLRQGVKWHDGQPFTAADVQFSMMEIWKKLHGRGRSTYDKVTSVETPDDHTVLVTLSEPSPVILNALSSYESQVVPKHVFEGADIAGNPALNAPIGTGPFKFAEWKKGQYIRLVRNPDYWDAPKPHLDEVVLQVIPDGGARAASLESGETLMGVFNPVALADISRIEKAPGLRVTTGGYGLLAPMFLMEFNLDKKPFDQVEVRQAVAHAIDRNFIVKNIYFGFGEPATGPIASSSRQYTGDVPQYPYDVQAAARLLDEAGYPAGKDGIRFGMTLDTLRDPETLRTAEYIRQALRRVGIQVELRNSDLGTFIRNVYAEYAFDATLNFSYSLSDPTLGVDRFYLSSNISKGTPFVNTSVRIERVDELLRQARVENDVARRTQMFHEFQRVVAEQLPILNLFEMRFVTVLNDKVQGYDVSGEGPYASFKEVWLTP